MQVGNHCEDLPSASVQHLLVYCTEHVLNIVVPLQVGNHCEDFPAECGWSVGRGSNADESGDVST